MGFVSDFVDGLFGGQTDAEEAAEAAKNTAVSSQTEALNYLKEREKIPQQFREGALQELGGIYGLEGGTGNQEELIARAQNSPLYAAIMNGQKAGESSILRNASATGGLRSGNVQGAMYDYNLDLKTKALLESYNQQLKGLNAMAQLPSNANTIAQGITGIGTTMAQGIVAEGRAEEQGKENSMNMLTGGIGGFLGVI